MDAGDTTVSLPGARAVRGTLDRGGAAADADTRRVVVACPPHPEHGGDRHDSRLRAVSDALRDRGVDCLRIDYGAFDGGRGERTDALTALDWAVDRYDSVGLFGYSFGGAVAVLAAGDRPPGLAAVSALAPASQLAAGLDVVAAVSEITVSLQIVYGTRDDTVDATPVADRAREYGHAVEAVPADHFFVGQRDRVGTLVADMLAGAD